MEAILRPIFIYFFLVIAFSIAGKRSLGDLDTFDLISLMIISEVTQNALIQNNLSVTYASIVIITLLACSVFMGWLKYKNSKVENFIEGGAIIILDNGRLCRERMKKSYIDEEDILSKARLSQGIERLEQIKYAILEANGQISIIPKQ
jgi:uncharacterized membrane protein YcaP (DUF421 family)